MEYLFIGSIGIGFAVVFGIALYDLHNIWKIERQIAKDIKKCKNGIREKWRLRISKS